VRHDDRRGRVMILATVAGLMIALLAYASAPVVPPVAQARELAAQLPTTGVTQAPTSAALPTATSIVPPSATNTTLPTATVVAVAASTSTLAPVATSAPTQALTSTVTPPITLAPASTVALVATVAPVAVAASVDSPAGMAPSVAAPVAPSALPAASSGPPASAGSNLPAYWQQVESQHQYYNGPNHAYDNQWYQQRHVNNPWLYQAFAYEPVSQCGTYYYRFQNAYYCYTGGTASAFGPGGLISPPAATLVQTPTGYAQASYWANLAPQYQYYNGPSHSYEDEWYAQRHLSAPLLYRSFSYEPAGECSTYYYQYQQSYYCYTGISVYSAGDVNWSVPIRYWAAVDPQARYYYGPDYTYDEAWYAQRHLGNPAQFQSYDYSPGGECGTYYYQYQGLYYCYAGA
jgi:hypothetical protein